MSDTFWMLALLIYALATVGTAVGFNGCDSFGRVLLALLWPFTLAFLIASKLTEDD